MEFKYAKDSKTLKELQTEIKVKEEQERKNIEQAKKIAKENKIAQMKKQGYFEKAQEMIDWVLSGKRIIDDYEGGWIQLINREIVHHSFELTDAGFPIGYVDKHMSIENFKEWVRKCEEYQIKDHDIFVNDCFHKDLNY